MKTTINKLDEQASDMQVMCFDRMNKLLSKNLGNVDSDELDNELKTINLASRMVNNYQMMKRIQQGQQIRVFNVLFEDKDTMKQYIEMSMPNMLPQIETK